MQDHRKLIVWQKAHALAVHVNRVTRPLERRDRSGFVTQARRAALSIASNIAEGCGRSSNRDLAKFVQIAIGSASELDYQLEFARDAGILPPNESLPLRDNVVEIRRMLHGLLRRIRESLSTEN